MYQSYKSFGDIHSCHTEVTGAVASQGGGLFFGAVVTEEGDDFDIFFSP